MQVLRDLKGEEYEALKADIAKRGVIIPIEVDAATGEVLDGFHRLRACRELGKEAPQVERDLGGESPIEYALKLNLLRRHMTAVDWAEAFTRLLEERGIERGQGTRNDLTSATVAEVAAELGVAERTAERRLSLLGLPQELQEQVRSGERTARTALQEGGRQERRARAAEREGDGRKALPVAAGQYQTIVIDPPWWYEREDIRGAADHHYDTMGLEELMALPVGALVQPTAHLYLWTTNLRLPDAFRLVEAWDFDYKTLLTWVKPQIGTGHYFRGATEHVLFCVRGTLPLRADDIRNWFEAPRTEHSAKPDVFYEIVERASYGPYLDMFARSPRAGWDVHGDESGR